MAHGKPDFKEIATDKLAGAGIKSKAAKEPMKQHNFRMYDRDYKKLQLHFQEKGGDCLRFYLFCFTAFKFKIIKDTMIKIIYKTM